MYYRVLRWIVWKGGRWYLRRRRRGQPTGVGLAGLARAVRIARRFGR